MYEEEVIAKAVNVIENQGVVILPADTVYGIFGGLFFPDVVERVYKIKGRKRQKPFGIYCTKQNVEELGELNLTARRLIDHFWPGPLSIIVNKKEIISDTFTNNNPTILLLSAKNRILSEVVRRCSIPIFSTTCNFSGEEEITEPSLLKPFENLVNFVGVVQNFHFHSRVTTTVNCIEQPPKIIRHGAINVQQIKDIIPEIQENLSLLIQ